MRIAVLLPVVAFAVGCSGEAPPPANCAVRPADFRSFAEPRWYGPGIPIEPPTPIRIAIGRDGRPRWNDAPLGGTDGWATLADGLATARQMEQEPFVTIVFARGAPCAGVERARRLIRRSVACGPVGRCFQGTPPGS